MALLFHECGSPLLMEGKWCGDCFIAKFFDGREEGEGKRIKKCPTCGDPLGEAVKKDGFTE